MLPCRWRKRLSKTFPSVMSKSPYLPALLASLSIVAQLPAQTPSTAQTWTSSAAAADTVFRKTGVMVLQPGDIVRLRIWREPDLSGDFPVDEEGIVVFPKIGPRDVRRASPAALREALVRDYQVYLRNPSIDVIMLRRINVLGAVRNPGLYPVDPTMSLADVVAAAGGVAPQGRMNEAQLIRGGETIKHRITAETRMTELQLRSGDQIFVPERNWAARNSGVVAAAITASVSLLIALVR